MQIKVKKLHPDAVIPHFATDGAAGFDFHAIGGGTVYQGRTAMIDTGLAFEVPKGFALLIVGRSGNGAKWGSGVPQGFGTIDSDYRGEVKILLRTDRDFSFEKGDRLAQGIIVQVPSVELIESEELSDTQRGAGGFGSTGV